MAGDDAVAGGPHVREPGGYGLVDEHGASRAGLSTGLDEEVSVGSDPDDDEDEVDVPRQGFTVGGLAVDVESGVARADLGDG